jgi:hypothetical protein
MTVAINVLNRLIVIMDARCVLREVETEILHVIHMKLCFKININFQFLISYKDDKEVTYNK